MMVSMYCVLIPYSGRHCCMYDETRSTPREVSRGIDLLFIGLLHFIPYHPLTITTYLPTTIRYTTHIAMSDNEDSPINVDHSDTEDDVKPKAEEALPRKRVRVCCSM